MIHFNQMSIYRLFGTEFKIMDSYDSHKQGDNMTPLTNGVNEQL